LPGPKELIERPAAKSCEDHLKHLAAIAAMSNVTRPSSGTRLSATRGGGGEAVITARLLPAPQAVRAGTDSRTLARRVHNGARHKTRAVCRTRLGTPLTHPPVAQTERLLVVAFAVVLFHLILDYGADPRRHRGPRCGHQDGGPCLFVVRPNRLICHFSILSVFCAALPIHTRRCRRTVQDLF